VRRHESGHGNHVQQPWRLVRGHPKDVVDASAEEVRRAGDLRGVISRRSVTSIVIVLPPRSPVPAAVGAPSPPTPSTELIHGTVRAGSTHSSAWDNLCQSLNVQ
jgi:hypothetical protein